jgi:hypothetical protein
MASGGYWAADSIAQSIESARDRAHSNAELAKAERYHRGSISQLSAALAALRNLAPEHPLNSRVVRDQVDAAGEKTKTFQAAWGAGESCDPFSILRELQQAHEEAKAETLRALAGAEVTHKKRGFFKRRDIFYFLSKTEHPTSDAAEAVRDKAISIATAAKLGDSVDLQSVLAVAGEKGP